jgi:epoxide hydrolase-like predicted phosphatase
MIKAILFDYDGVLTTDNTGSHTTNKHIGKVSGLSYDVVERAFTPFNFDLNIGRTTYEEVWPVVCSRMNYELDISVLQDAFKSTPRNTEMFSLARKLKSRYAVGIITDNKKDRMDCLKVVHNLADIFDPIIVSAEQGVSKQDPEIFECALQRLRLRPEETVFVDNTQSNLIAPRTIGIHAIFHDDVRNDVQGLSVKLVEEYGIELDN